jgi:nucleotide-binding universal stress UspA family protein
MKVMATFDRSPYSESILGVLQEVAALPDITFTFLAVAEPFEGKRRRGPRRRPTAIVLPGATAGDAIVVEPGPQSFVERKDQAISRELTELEEYLHDIARLLPKGIRYTVDAQVGEHPSQIIIARARRDAPDVIVMATHGHTGLVRSLFGSVSEEVVRSGVAPVLLVHPEDVKRHRSALAE